MPMVADVLRHFPDANIDWVVEEAYVGLVRLNPHISNVIPVALRRWRKCLGSAGTRREIADFYRRLRRDVYDIVFDTQGLLKTSVIMRLARLAPGGKRVGLANATEGSGYEPVSRIFHTQSVSVGLRMHAVMRARTVAAAALGYLPEGAPDFGLLSLSRQETVMPEWLPRQPYAVFFHSSARVEKQWSSENWVAIAQILEARHLPILLPWGSASEKQAAQQLAAGMARAIVLPPLSLAAAATLIRQAALVVGLDTGLTHLAAAFGRPTVELYCDSPRWKTEGNWSPCIANVGDMGHPPNVSQVMHGIDAVLSAEVAQDGHMPRNEA